MKLGKGKEKRGLTMEECENLIYLQLKEIGFHYKFDRSR